MPNLEKCRADSGLIAEIDFNRPELHGFEIGLDGRLWVPSFPPRSDDATLVTALKDAA